tara:strand:+ start:26279 stop:27349 length:1071 start_codon:yes stop_codon:yes gene_type:complete
MICEILEEQNYTPFPFLRGDEALASVEGIQPDIVLLDAIMPELDGYEICEQIHKIPSLQNVPVIFVSGLNEPLEKVRAFRCGAVDFLTKPFHAQEIDARITSHLRLRKLQEMTQAKADTLGTLVEEKSREISESQLALIYAMATLSESRDYETGQHMKRIQNFCSILAETLRENSPYSNQIDDEFLENIYRTSPLHDIGKVGIEDAILLKPGKLTPQEFDIMKRHSVIGAETLQTIHAKYPHNEFLRMGIEIARSHHERWDGSGYPDGLAGTNIPLAARIMGLADVYDALRAKRPYKEPFSHEKAVAIIRNDSGTHFDPCIADAFLSVEQQFSAAWERIALEESKNGVTTCLTPKR